MSRTYAAYVRERVKDQESGRLFEVGPERLFQAEATNKAEAEIAINMQARVSGLSRPIVVNGPFSV